MFEVVASDVVPFTQARANLSELADIVAERTQEADTALAQIQQRRKASAKKSSTAK